MPSTVTHSYFITDVYNRLNNKELLSPYFEQLKTFAQGPDVFFFYSFFCPRYNRIIRTLGQYIHQTDTQLFFINLITKIKKNKLSTNPEVLAFLYGFVSHYVLDMTMHPYIIYKTGVYYPKNKDTFKYAFAHHKLESYLDAYLIRVRAKVTPIRFKVHNFCLNNTGISNTLKELIDEVWADTFKEKDIGIKYEKSIHDMKLFYKLFRYDKLGIKKYVYKTIQSFIPHFKIDFLSYNIKLNKDDYYLNLGKEPWHHPLNKDIIYNHSVIELYAIALDKTLRLLREIDAVLLNKYSIEYLKKLFPNFSYLTGVDCKLGIGTYFSY